MHLLLDLALRRGHLDADAARRLQAEVEGGRALNEVLVGAGLSSQVVAGLAAELQAAAQGVTEELTNPGGPARVSAETVLEGPPGGPPARRERDHETAWVSSSEDVVAPLPAMQEFARGDRIGDFELLELLGEGGMGAVYRAREVGLEREVALKIVSNKIAVDPDAKERFLREARSAGQISHPNVITILRVSKPEESRPYMALEFLRGGDAEDLRIAAGGKLPTERALEIARDCARGLGALEQRGLVHRDIKPANVFLTGQGVAKLADLGLARAQSGDDRVTRTGVIVGTPTFMSPEQALGEEDLDIRSDIYALGASLFLLVTGAVPFVGKNPLSVVSKVVHEPTPDPRTHAPELPAAVARLVLTAMAKRPEDRYQSAAELERAVEETLQALREGRGDEGPAFSPPAGADLQRASGLATAVALAPEDEPTPTGWKGALGKLLFVVVCCAFLALLWSTRRRAQPFPPASSRPAGTSSPSVAAPELTPVARPPAQVEWSAPPGVSLVPPTGAPGPLNFGVANLGGSQARRVSGAGPGVAYRFEPGRGKFARSSLFGGSKLELPARVLWRLSDIDVRHDVAAGPLAEAQGLGKQRTGIFFELGVRPTNTPCVEGAALEPGSLWVTLQLSRKGELVATFRRLNADKVDRINLGDPGVGHVHEPREGRPRKRELTLGLELRESGWRFQFADSEVLSGSWAEGPAPLKRGEIRDGLYLWTHAGNWEEGRGRATVEVQLLRAKKGKPIGILGRPRKTGRTPRRPRKR